MLNLVLIAILVLLVFYLRSYEGFELYFNTAENREKYTCDLIPKEEPLYSEKKDFGEDVEPYELTYLNKEQEGPYAQCKDNVMDFNIEDNYKLNFDKNFKNYFSNPAKSGDIYYKMPHTCPNTSPLIYNF
jgi:hypothetical protein